MTPAERVDMLRLGLHTALDRLCSVDLSRPLLELSREETAGLLRQLADVYRLALDHDLPALADFTAAIWRTVEGRDAIFQLQAKLEIAELRYLFELEPAPEKTFPPARVSEDNGSAAQDRGARVDPARRRAIPSASRPRRKPKE